MENTQSAGDVMMYAAKATEYRMMNRQNQSQCFISSIHNVHLVEIKNIFSNTLKLFKVDADLSR